MIDLYKLYLNITKILNFPPNGLEIIEDKLQLQLV